MGQVGSLLPGNKMPEVQDWLWRAEPAARMRRGRRNTLGAQAGREAETLRMRKTNQNQRRDSQGQAGYLLRHPQCKHGAEQTQGPVFIAVFAERQGRAGQVERGREQQTRKILWETGMGERAHSLIWDPAQPQPLQLRVSPP